MIVVDANVVAAFWLRGPRSALARRAHRRDPVWIAPPLWRSEFRSVLRQYHRTGELSLSRIVWFADKAEAMLRGRERPVRSADVLRLVARTGHSSYDCEYVALAEVQGVRLVTGDRRLVQAFPETAMLLEDFAA